MIFSSSIFLFAFLPCVLFFYYITPRKYRNIILLFFSLLFYWWGQPSYLVLLLLSILINWLAGVAIHVTSHSHFRRVFLVIGLIANIGLLGLFKYADFIVTTINQITHQELPLLGIVLPIGISFYTFQGMSYIIDIYRGTCN